MIEERTGASYLIEMNPRCTPPSPLPFGNGRNLVAALWSQITGLAASSNLPVIEQNTIAYSPLVEASAGRGAEASRNGLPHYYAFHGETELMQKLLRPSLRRSVLGKLVDLVRRKQHQQPPSITFSTNELGPPVGKKRTAEMLS